MVESKAGSAILLLGDGVSFRYYEQNKKSTAKLCSLTQDQKFDKNTRENQCMDFYGYFLSFNFKYHDKFLTLILTSFAISDKINMLVRMIMVFTYNYIIGI
ncbi:hypothetical protein [Clostridium thermarum]|uniref:hypothetical protein n=1 Tax=Clostridium thermarum TaxID=1716543 RepID=UPI001120556A|nr:hypothetical protein [Clostridium thermarum]